MVVYSIQDLEKLSGIKASTLRMWEKRYGVLKPKRTSTNIRYYQDEDLKKLLHIALLNRNGYKISCIADMSEEDISTIVAELSSVDTIHEDDIDAMMLSMFELDESKLNRILDKHIDTKGMQKTMDEHIYPFLDKLSTMWYTGSIKGVHENFVEYLIRRKLLVSIDKCEIKKPEASCILYLPEEETQELTLLYIHYLLKSSGVAVVNLGTNVSLADVIEAQQIYKADFMITLFNDSYSDGKLQSYIDQLCTHINNCQILVSGFQVFAQNISLPDQVSILDSISELDKTILQRIENISEKEKTFL